MLVAWLVVDVLLDVREAGALAALVPFLDTGTLFAHPPSGAGPADQGCPFIDDLACDDGLEDCA